MARKKKPKTYKNKYGVSISLDLIRLGEKYAQKVSEQRAIQREKILKKKYIRAEKGVYVEATVGEIQGLVASKYMGETSFQDLNSVYFNKENMRSVAQAKKKVQTLRALSTKKYQKRKAKIYKESLLKSIDTKFGNMGDPQFIDDLKRKIKRMNAQELSEFAYTTEVYNIDFVYGSPETQATFDLFANTVEEFYANKYKK